MATRTATRSVLPGIRRRLYSSQAAARPNQSESTPLPRQDPKLTRLPNGILVASLENYSPVSRVSVAFHAGARFEDGDNNGVTHCLRAASYLSNKNSSNFKLAKSSQQIGSNITCAAGREYIHYTLECTRDNVSTGLSFLNDITSPTFKPWELAEFQPRLAFDRAVLAMQPNIEVIELLHEAAFKKTLGQSLYAPQYMIGNYSQEQLLSYVNQFFTSDRMAIVGVGVDHDYLCEQGSRFNPANPTGNDGEPVVYLGGELRKPSRSDLVYAAVGAEGPSLSGKDVLPSGVLQMIMGTGPYVKYSQGLASSRLAQAAAAATSEPFAISCINANYQLSGLFGFCAAAQAKDIGKVLKTAFSQFASVTKNGVTEQELARGKAQLKSAISMQLEDGYNMALHLAEDVLTHKQITSLSELNKAIDAVTVSDVVAVAKRIVNGKPSMASVGNLTHTPCLDELYK